MRYHIPVAEIINTKALHIPCEEYRRRVDLKRGGYEKNKKPDCRGSESGRW